MNAKHAPGPWHRNIKPASKYGVIFAGRNTHVCTLSVQGLTEEEIEANCNLITAAPDLLQAVERCVEYLYNPFEPDNQSPLYQRLQQIIKQAKEGI